jgi:hypothetical protein
MCSHDILVCPICRVRSLVARKPAEDSFNLAVGRMRTDHDLLYLLGSFQSMARPAALPALNPVEVPSSEPTLGADTVLTTLTASNEPAQNASQLKSQSPAQVETPTLDSSSNEIVESVTLPQTSSSVSTTESSSEEESRKKKKKQRRKKRATAKKTKASKKGNIHVFNCLH